ncbi:MAG: hypothetical protein PHH45_00535 [Patescibacteria group bacterium]|jgi:hypothetical protein|nr:hypothetical protein [Patescibacteria group bacterium]
MTGDQIVAATDRYDRELEKEEIPVAEHPHDIICMMRRAALAHLRTMFPKMVQFVSEDKIEKAMRWLGFVQGVLWVCGVYTLEQLKADNR